jgi:hypothetical protein
MKTFAFAEPRISNRSLIGTALMLTVVLLASQVYTAGSEADSPPPIAVEITSATVSSEHLHPEGDCEATPDLVEASAQVTPADEHALVYRWLVDGEQVDIGDVPQDGVLTLNHALPGHLPHKVYEVRLQVALEVPEDPDLPGKGKGHKYGILKRSGGQSGAVVNVVAYPQVNNLPPHVYALEWYRSEDPCEEVTDTPAATAHTAQASVVAAPALGTEQAPGVFLNVTAAACDPDGDDLRFTFVAGEGSEEVLGLTPADAFAGFQSAKLSQFELKDEPQHVLFVVVDDSPGAVEPEAYVPDSTQSNLVAVADPREQLRREVAQYGFQSLEEFQDSLAPIIERAQADFRIQATGATAEMGFYNANPPVYYSPAAPDDALIPVLLDGRAGTPNLLVDDVPFTLLRRDAWVGFLHTLSPEEEARGEYFTALLNAEASRIGLSDFGDLAAHLPDGETIYRPQEESGPRCFPRQNAVHFSLPDQLFLFQAMDILKQSAFSSFGWLLETDDPSLVAPPMPAIGFQDLADLGRLFNARTVPISSGGVNQPHQPGPDKPRVQVRADVGDAGAPFVVCWTFSDPNCHLAQQQARIQISGHPDIVVTDPNARSVPLPALPLGYHTVTVEVTNTQGRTAARSVAFLAPGVEVSY